MSEEAPDYLQTDDSTKRIEPPKPSDGELRNRFIYHPPPNQARIDAHSEVSKITCAMAIHLRDICPAGRNLSLALTHLEDVRMRANAALACDSPAEASGP